MTNSFEILSIQKVLRKETVVDIGGGSPHQKNLDKLENSRNNLFITVDFSPASRPTILGDIHFVPLKNNCAGGVICKAVLEHVKNPFVVVSEIRRILKPGGIAYFWVPFLYPYHPNKNYADYFRYTRDGVEVLLDDFSNFQIEPSLPYFQTVVELLPFPVSKLFKYPAKLLDNVIRINNQNSGWHIFATK